MEPIPRYSLQDFLRSGLRSRRRMVPSYWPGGRLVRSSGQNGNTAARHVGSRLRFRSQKALRPPLPGSFQKIRRRPLQARQIETRRETLESSRVSLSNIGRVQIGISKCPTKSSSKNQSKAQALLPKKG